MKILWRNAHTLDVVEIIATYTKSKAWKPHCLWKLSVVLFKAQLCLWQDSWLFTLDCWPISAHLPPQKAQSVNWIAFCGAIYWIYKWMKKFRLEMARQCASIWKLLESLVAVNELLSVWMLSTIAFAKAFPQSQVDIDVVGKPEKSSTWIKLWIPRQWKMFVSPRFRLGCFPHVRLMQSSPWTLIFRKENAQLILMKSLMPKWKWDSKNLVWMIFKQKIFTDDKLLISNGNLSTLLFLSLCESKRFFSVINTFMSVSLIIHSNISEPHICFVCSLMIS